MMEVKHNTPVEFSDLTSTSNGNGTIAGSDSGVVADDELVQNLKSSLLKDDLLQANERITNGLLPEMNGSDVVDLDGVDLDMDVINPELEEKLLADDDADVVDKLLADVIPSTALETPDQPAVNQDATTVVDPTESSDAVRDPGDDLDTLLSKINDIVDDCSESQSAKSPLAEKLEVEEDLINCDTPAKSTTDTETLNDTDQDPSDISVIVLDDSIVEVNDKAAENSSAATNESSSTATSKTSSKDVCSTEESEDASRKIEVDIKDKESSTDKESNAISLDDNRAELGPSDKIILDVDLEDLGSNSKNEERPQESEVRSRSQSLGESTALESSEQTLENEELVKGSETKTPEIDDSTETSTKESELNGVAKEDVEISPSSLSPEADDLEPKTNESESSTVAKKDSEATPPSINLDGDESDDDVVFFYDCNNGAEEKDNSGNLGEEKPETADEPKPEVEDEFKEVEDDDVVLLDDEDEEKVPGDSKEDEESFDVQTTEDKKDESAMEESSAASVTSEDKAVKEAEEKPEETKTDGEAEDNTKKTESKESEILTSQENGATEKDEDQVLDDSDNAQDKFDEEKSEKQEVVVPSVAKTAVPTDVEETNSNCSSSSNLLQEAKESSSVEGEEETDQGNDDEYDAVENECEAAVDVDVMEVVDEEYKEASEEKISPPAKRIRLSVEDDDANNKEQITESKNIEGTKQIAIDQEDVNDPDVCVVKEEMVETKEAAKKSEGEKPSLKRSHESSPDQDMIETATKKTKPEEEQTEIKPDSKDIKPVDGEENQKECSKSIDIETKDINAEVALDKVSPEADKSGDSIPTVKAIPSDIPVPLYPPPDFQTTTSDLNLDFLKRFKKSLDKITKGDLEELVLQKIVEAIIHKSEFGEMRELVEKQEKIIATLRTKISELSKQFRDLEMVHNRVLKDIESKNSQFLMPVKITRAVGLQVQIPYKKSSDPVSNAAANSLSPPGVDRNANAHHPYRAPNPGPHLTSPSRAASSDFGSSSTVSSSISTRITNTALASAVAAAAANTRRGCVQKITPHRPIEPMSSVSSSSSAASSSSLAPAYRAAQQQAAQSTQQGAPKLLNKSAATGAGQQRGRYSGPASMMPSQQQHARQQQPSPTNQFRKIAPTNAAMSKQSNSSLIAQQYRRSESMPQASISPASMTDNYTNSMHQQTSGMPAVSILPAKPKEKSVIDLTDEDDAPATASPTPAVLRQRLSAGGGGVGPSSYLLNKMPNAQSRLQASANHAGSKAHVAGRMLYGSKANGNAPVPTNLSTPTHGGVTRVTIGAQQRAKYGHPAPLPPTPTQNLNPAWKMPPPRPTIRISNLDNGIVISWTVEESMERHAECVSYQIYAYQETSGPPLIDSWRHVGDVKAMLLPMAVTLTQFQEGQRYYFAVRAVDVHHRVGPFSLPKTWS